MPATRGGTDCVLREPEDDRFGDPALLRKAGTVERRKGGNFTIYGLPFGYSGGII